MNGIFFALLALFLFGALLRMDWVYYLAYVVAGVWIFSNWSVRRSLRHVQVTCVMLDKAFVGTQIDVRVVLENRSRVPLPWLVLEERVPLDLKDIAEYRVALSVAGNSTTIHSYTFAAKRRGYFSVGPLQLRSGDLFGFAEAAWEEMQPRYITVYPLILPLQRLGLPSRIPMGGRNTVQRLYEDPARLSGVRSYASGDSQRRIHWKATAHANTLLVKRFQPAIGLNCMVIVDFNREAYGTRNVVSNSEWAISVAASVAASVAGSRQPVGLLASGIDAAAGTPPLALTPRTGQGQLTAILSTLARLNLQENAPPVANWLVPRLAELEWGTTVVMITPHVSEKLLLTLHQAVRRGSSIVLLLCGEQADAKMMMARADRLAIEMHHTLWERDLETL